MTAIDWVLSNAKDIVQFGVLLGAVYKGNLVMTSINKKLEVVPTLETDVREIKLQLKTNGGSSLKDAITRVERTTEAIKSDVKVINGREGARIYLDAQPTFECDGNGSAINLNKSLLEILGLELDEAIGYGWLRSVAFRDQERVQREWENSVRNGREFNSKYTFINAKTKKEVRVNGRARIEREGKEITFIIGTCDILED